MQNLYSIDEFAKIKQVTTEKLRYYNRIALLKPEIVDEEVSSCYYVYNQLIRYDIIQAYKELGLSIREIKKLCEIQDERSLLQVFIEKKRHMESRIQALNEALITMEHVSNRIDESYDTKDYLPLIKEYNTRYAYLMDDTDINGKIKFHQFMQKQNLQSTYCGGDFYGRSKNVLKKKYVFECVTGNRVRLEHCSKLYKIEAGFYLCYPYNGRNRETAFEDFVSMLSQYQIQPHPILDTYMVNGTSNQPHRRFLLESKVERL